MYHCSILFNLIGSQRGIFETVRKIPPLEHFAHTFVESERPEASLLAQADVILADVQDMDAGTALRLLAGGMKPGAELIVLAGREQVPALADSGSALKDIWVMPMGEEEVRFRFLRWQQSCRLAKDYWQSQQFLDVAIESTPNVIWYKSRDGVHERVNESLCSMAGKPREQVQGQTYADIWGIEEDSARMESELEVMRSGETRMVEELAPVSGSKTLMSTYKSPLFDLDGSVMGTMGLAINVTREREYEQELADKSRTLEMLFSSMDCGIVCHSVDGSQIFSVNKAALKLLDYNSKEEMLQAGFYQVAQSVLDEDKPKLRECINSLKKAGDSVSVEYRVGHRDGKVLHILGNVKLVKENGELFYQRFLLDYTDQKHLEEQRWAEKTQAIQYQEQMFEMFSTFLSDNIDDVYMVLDEAGYKVEFVSPNIERVLGISAEDILNDAWAIGHAEYVTGCEVGNVGLAALEPGMALEPMDTKRIHKKTGEEKWFRESVYCVSMQGNKKIIVYISDRTIERQTENTLNEALEMAQVANRAKSAFLSNVSHDIRTPMNAIMGFVTLLKEETDNPERVKEYTQKISAASQHMLELINDVLDMNKIESGSAVLKIAEMNLAELIDEINTFIGPQTRAKGQSFEIAADSLTDETLLGDKLRISQILINILSNAVKYTQEGGHIKLCVEEMPQVDKSYRCVRFTVSDNGMGMSEEFQKVIFEPFTREQSVAWNTMQGTGLGMAITKNLVDLMNGSVSVTSTLGEGSTFTVELELRIADKETVRRKTDTAKKRASLSEGKSVVSGRRVLVVDDIDVNRTIMVKILTKMGAQCDEAVNGQEAVEKFEASGPGEYDMILMDIQMPTLNGYEATRAIRASIHPSAGEIPVIAMSANAFVDDVRDALQAGMDAHVAKPIIIDQMEATLRKVLERKGLL